MVMRILIIEDEKHNAARLQRILTELSGDFKVVDILETVKESVEWFNRGIDIDVALMDIRLADGLSFDIFEQTDVKSPVIFTTSYDEYAIRAFKVNSIDYLLKPIEREELLQALNKVKIRSEETKTNPEIEQLLQLFKEQKPVFRKRFILPKYDGYKMIAVEEIDYIFLENKITYLVTKEGKKEAVQQTMEDLNEELNPEDFFRANRQFIIHINTIGMIQNSDNGKVKVVLKRNQNQEIFVSREKAGFLKKWLDK